MIHYVHIYFMLSSVEYYKNKKIEYSLRKIKSTNLSMI